jgi:PhnB protein
MASDSQPEYYAKPASLFVSIHLQDPDEADRIFYALAENGSVTMPIEKTFWAARFGMLVDRFGTPWMVNCDLPADAATQGTSESELARAR